LIELAGIQKIKDNFRLFQPFILDDVSVNLGPWSGYNNLAQHPNVTGFIGGEQVSYVGEASLQLIRICAGCTCATSVLSYASLVIMSFERRKILHREM